MFFSQYIVKTHNINWAWQERGDDFNIDDVTFTMQIFYIDNCLNHDGISQWQVFSIIFFISTIFRWIEVYNGGFHNDDFVRYGGPTVVYSYQQLWPPSPPKIVGGHDCPKNTVQWLFCPPCCIYKCIKNGFIWSTSFEDRCRKSLDTCLHHIKILLIAKHHLKTGVTFYWDCVLLM